MGREISVSIKKTIGRAIFYRLSTEAVTMTFYDTWQVYLKAILIPICIVKICEYGELHSHPEKLTASSNKYTLS